MKQASHNLKFLDAANDSLWFLPAIFLASILFDIVNHIRYKGLCCMGLLVVGYVFSFYRYLLPWSIDTVPVVVVVMLVGHVLSIVMGERSG